MSGDAVHSVDAVKSWRARVENLRRESVRLQTIRDTVIEDLDRTRKEIEKLSSKVDRLIKAGELLRLLMDKLVIGQVKAIEEVVTEGLRSIFHDQDLNFEAEIGQFRNKISIELMLRRHQNGVEIVGPPLETAGGGISSVASLTLRLLALMRLNKYPLLLLDETLSAVSDDYVDATGQFLAKLSESTGIPILLVTHKHSFLEHATVAYQGFEETDSDGWCMELKQLRGPS